MKKKRNIITSGDNLPKESKNIELSQAENRESLRETLYTHYIIYYIKYIYNIYNTCLYVVKSVYRYICTWTDK